MNTLNYNNISFLKSAAEISHLPPDSGAEVAFAGRSNAGKSTAINIITGIGRLARVSKTPGRTQLINFFELDPQRRLVDLPGYGYAKVPEAVRLRWQRVLEQYLIERKSLRGLILLMDIRHPLKEFDCQMIEWSVAQELPMHILLTKADKFGRGAAQNILWNIRKQLIPYEEYVSIQLFSGLKKFGVEDVHLKLDEWFQDMQAPNEQNYEGEIEGPESA